MVKKSLYNLNNFTYEENDLLLGSNNSNPNKLILMFSGDSNAGHYDVIEYINNNQSFVNFVSTNEIVSLKEI